MISLILNKLNCENLQEIYDGDGVYATAEIKMLRVKRAQEIFSLLSDFLPSLRFSVSLTISDQNKCSTFNVEPRPLRGEHKRETKMLKTSVVLFESFYHVSVICADGKVSTT